MSDSIPALTYKGNSSSSDRSTPYISGLLGLAALVMASLTIYVAGTVGFQFLGDFRAKYAIAADLTAGLLTCSLFMAAAWMRFSRPDSILLNSHRITTVVIFLAVYGPFCWVVTAPRWALFSPVLPGFVAGVFTRPFNNIALCLTACCIDAALILWSLSIIRSRHRHGFIFSVVIALTISSLTSYSAYCAMRA